MQKQQHTLFLIILAALALVVASLGCYMPGPVQPTPTVAIAATPLETPTPSPTVDAIATAVAAQTMVADAVQLTMQAGIDDQPTQEAQVAEDTPATDAVPDEFAPVIADLPKYDIDPSTGKPGWVHPQVVLEIDGYQDYAYANQYPSLIVADFVISADITWNTQYGTSGCGFVVRSNGDQVAPNHYMVVATRAGNGHVAFAVVLNGDIVGGTDFIASLKWQNDTTNRLTLVGRGNYMTIYTNGAKVGAYNIAAFPEIPALPSPPEKPPAGASSKVVKEYKQAKEVYDETVAEILAEYNRRVDAAQNNDIEYEQGFVAFMAVNESGRTRCQFDNAWLWLLDE
jgi:hypothetical protein